MLTDKEIEYFVFTTCLYCNETKIKEIYKELEKKYNTSIEWLDKAYFEKENFKISNLNISELEEFVGKIKILLLHHFWKEDNLFYSSYFWIIRWLVSDLLSWEYWKLSNSFKLDNGIKNYFREELLFVFPFVSTDYSKVWFVIDSLDNKKNHTDNSRYEYRNRYYEENYKK